MESKSVVAPPPPKNPYGSSNAVLGVPIAIDYHSPYPNISNPSNNIVQS